MDARRPYARLSHRTAGTNWLKRSAFVALGLAFALVAVFFITVALAAGTFLALVIAVRWWWTMRRVRSAQKKAGALEGEYTVIDGANDSRS